MFFTVIQALKKASRRGHAGSDDEEEGDGDGEEMAALMRRTARLAGKKAGAKGKGGDGDGDKRSVMYKDFFGDEDGDGERVCGEMAGRAGRAGARVRVVRGFWEGRAMRWLLS